MRNGRFQAGFTLIEVVVSMMILTVGIMASLVMMNAARKAIAYGKNRTEAAGLARAKMEEERALSFEALVSGPDRGEETINGFRRDWTVRRGTPGPRLATVRVSVAWTDPGNQSHRVTLGMVRAEGVVP
jgi:type IV pilus assembly protein PilV